MAAAAAAVAAGGAATVAAAGETVEEAAVAVEAAEVEAVLFAARRRALFLETLGVQRPSWFALSQAEAMAQAPAPAWAHVAQALVPTRLQQRLTEHFQAPSNVVQQRKS